MNQVSLATLVSVATAYPVSVLLPDTEILPAKFSVTPTEGTTVQLDTLPLNNMTAVPMGNETEELAGMFTCIPLVVV